MSPERLVVNGQVKKRLRRSTLGADEVADQQLDARQFGVGLRQSTQYVDEADRPRGQTVPALHNVLAQRSRVPLPHLVHRHPRHLRNIREPKAGGVFAKHQPENLAD